MAVELGMIPSRVLRSQLDAVVETWAELCRWDPELPPDTSLVGARDILECVADALDRPQPIGWGIDPALVGPAGTLAAAALSAEMVASQLVCLREALHQHVTERLPPSSQWEAAKRINMIVDRLTTHAVREATHHLRTLAFVDPLTGLPNRRAFDGDLARETSRARRHGHVLSLAMLDVDGLKATNDRLGHEAGDNLLRTVAMLLRSALRNEDVAYRIGGDEFAVLLPDIDATDESFLRDRLTSVGCPPVSLGVASSARDPIDELAARADDRLYEGRRRTRGR
jgi:diguanylate cyclase (GGDEF)-like protein